MWVTDSSDDKLYAYDLATKEHLPTNDFPLVSDNGDPKGIWSDGMTMWVVDNNDDKIYAYDLATKAHVPAKDFNTLRDEGNDSPYGIWSDGTTMWSTDDSEDKLYAYDARRLVNSNSLRSLSTRVAEIAAAPDLIASMSASSAGVFPSDTITLTATVSNTGGRPSATTTLRWYRSTNNTLDTETPVGTHALSSLAAGGTGTVSISITVPSTPDFYYYGVCADPVADEHYTNDNCSSTVRVIVSSHPHLPTSDFNLASGNTDPNGIWSDHFVNGSDRSEGATLWVADSGDDKLYAYSLSNKARLSAKEFNFSSANRDAEGIWSDGTTMWVADHQDDKIYAYDLATKAHVPASDFNTLPQSRRQ